MAKLPETFSLQAIPIQAAISEGRTEDAKTLIAAILSEGRADKVVQRLAALMIKRPKAKRGRKTALPRHWLEIGPDFHSMRDDGQRYEDVMHELAMRYGYSETHIRKAVALYDQAVEEAEEASRN
ncbi:hypothetical protein ACK6D9_11710 [Hoeflea sp. Naph1]|uniref:hypothetical protein n=1 Tax=Hoeflea sp. Naph1 TaxID=3388653 RepID=UPI00398FEA3B